MVELGNAVRFGVRSRCAGRRVFYLGAMRALIIAVVTLCSISAAGAQDPAGLPIPAGNVDAVCGRIGHPVSRAECVRAEQLNYDLVKSIWPNASEHAKLISIKKSEPFLNTTAYFNSIYTQLLAAMIDDQDAIDRTAPPKFMR